MNKIDTRPLFRYLKRNSSYFNSVAFFGVLLTVALTIPKTGNEQFNMSLIVLQASSLMLFILSLLVLLKNLLRTQSETIMTIFGILILIILLSLMGILFVSYKDVLFGMGEIIMVFVGIFHLIKIKDETIKIYNNGFRVLKRNWVIFLFFILIVLANIVAIYKKLWWTVLTNTSTFENAINAAPLYVFIGYAFGLFLLLISSVSLIFENRSKN